ncbi:MAG TPA: hypothetical protein VGR78_19765, partial [Verrucomicrobiae bacterium]|nr:hypothetical protein [Verrucomicrobiae bacterium]
MKIQGLRILPPFAIGRLGSAEAPVNNYTIEDNPDDPLAFRQITPADTFIIDPRTGEIGGVRKDPVTFKDGERIRPVAPFFEVFTVSSHGEMQPLTLRTLKELGLTEKDVAWRIEAANRKVFRRTNDPNDKVEAKTEWFNGHAPVSLDGRCKNFISHEAHIAFGQVRYIRPNPAFPQIRLRFMPGKGLIYGPKLDAHQVAKMDPEVYHVPREQAIYDTKKGRWYNFEVPAGIDNNDPNYKDKFVNETLPPSLYAITPPAPCWLNDNIAISRGYFDDACDGIIEVALKLKDGTELTASAR